MGVGEQTREPQQVIGYVGQVMAEEHGLSVGSEFDGLCSSQY